MITACLLGAGTGFGLVLLLYGLRPPRLSLAHTLAALHPTADVLPGTTATKPTGSPGGWVARVGRGAVPLLTRLGLPRPRTRADLAVCRRDATVHGAHQISAAAAGFLLPLLLAAGLAMAGIHLGVLVPAWASLALAGASLYLPEHRLRAQAARHRAELRAALSGMLDLVVVGLAGGAGVEQALRDATDDPRTWGQQQLRQAVHAAQLTRVPPWQTIGQLGTDANVPALTELAAALSLAGSEGARVRATLTARAASLREHQLSEAEAEAASATEKMSLPVVGLFGGFLVFIGFPALAAVLAAL
jgi:Flp pilus assembly protein TadB